VEVEDVADGQFKVQLEQMGVLAKDIAAYRRIETRLVEARTRLRQAARAAQPSTTQMQTRSKGTTPEGAEAEAMNQYRYLQEDELRCQLLQQQIQEKRRLLELCQPEDDDTTKTDSPLPP
jgi:division protein CdvB (Snf7/Vps24/ESCRT-III family)